MVKPPCYDEQTHTDCSKRRVGCKSDCPEWKEWERVHAEETEAIRNKRDEYDRVENFLSNQNRRVQMATRRERMRRYRRQ